VTTPITDIYYITEHTSPQLSLLKSRCLLPALSYHLLASKIQSCLPSINNEDDLASGVLIFLVIHITGVHPRKAVGYRDTAHFDNI